MSIYGDQRTPKIRSLVEDIHAFAIPILKEKKQKGEVYIPYCYEIELKDQIFKHCAKDLDKFLEKMVNPSEASPQFSYKFIFILSEREKNLRIEVSSSETCIYAKTLNDAWRACIWLEKKMETRHAPILKEGTYSLKQKLNYRITTSLFAKAIEKASDPDGYRDAYLRQVVQQGYSAIFLYVSLWDYCSSRIFPELNTPKFQHEIKALEKLVHRAKKYSLDIVLLINAPRIFPDHALFKRLPDVRGAATQSAGGYALCTSNPKTIDFFEEQMSSLFNNVPKLGGVAFLVGGEGLLHCYTRPVPRTQNVTNCKVCSKRRVPEVLLSLFNRITEKVKSHSAEAKVMFWPYSSFVWQNKSSIEYNWELDLEVIDHLDQRATWLLEIEKDAIVTSKDGKKEQVWDYSIRTIGPSQKLLLEQKKLKKRNIDLAIKTESNIDVVLHSLPYLPVMYRWLARCREIMKTDAVVSFESWRFTGHWPSPSVELAYWVYQEPECSDRELLARVAAKWYGKNNSGIILKAWKHFSKAWDYMLPTYGAAYYFGPLVIGPAHPHFLFSLQNIWSTFSLRTHPEFFRYPPGHREHETEKHVKDPIGQLPSFYTHALENATERLKNVGLASKYWEQGMCYIHEAYQRVQAPLREIAQKDSDMCEMVGIYLNADITYNKFIQLRDRYAMSAEGSKQRSKLRDKLIDLFESDLVRCERSLDLIKRTPFIGWGYTYGTRVSEEMLDQKMDHAKKNLNYLKNER